MKKAILFSVILFSVVAASAQQKKKTAIDRAVDGTCKCIDSVKAKIKTEADFDKYGEACIISAALPLLPEIAKEEKIPIDELSDSEEMGNKLGQKIGMKLVTDCPTFLELAAQYADDDEEEELTGKLKGTISSIEAGDQLYINVKDEAGKITKLVWLQYFPGADEYKDSPETLKGKKVSVQWKQVEFYAVKQKDFVTVKQVTKLEVE